MTRCWGSDVATVFDPAAKGTVRVLGGPGTGKTSLLVDVATAHIAAGVDPQSVLLVTGSGRVGAGTRSLLTTTLLAARTGAGGLPPVVGEPLVRTAHSYAFAVLHRAASAVGDPPPRLITGAEQDSIIRELLLGDHLGNWPASLHAALHTDGFIGELRNLMSRCAERGVSHFRLVQLGRRFGRPEWTAAGRFAQQYEQVVLLRSAVGRAAPHATVPALGAAELIGAVLEAFATDPALLAGERARIRLLLVDDAQQLDRQAAELVRVLAAGAGRTLIAGDPSQAVFGFRGGEPAALLTIGPEETGSAPSSRVTLTTSYRCSPAVASAISGLTSRLPGPGLPRRLDGTGTDDGSVTVRLAATRHAQTALIADTLRRAHLVDGVPWSRMAVIVRSVKRVADGLPRALAVAGVPVVLPAAAGPLCAQPAAAALLAVLTATTDGLDGQRALTLLTGPIGQLDPAALRQLRRALRRQAPGGSEVFADQLVALLGGDGPLPVNQAGPLRRVRAVLRVAAECYCGERDPHYTLWQVWQRSGLQRRWMSGSERAGPAGVQAGRDLAAVTALFDVAEQYVSRVAGASLRGFVEHVTAMHLAGPPPESAPNAEAVSVLSAHGALGHEWDLVIIAGLQEGLWPNTAPRGGVLHTQQLLDLLDGIGSDVSTRAPLLAEERRLLVAAMGRAGRRLVVTAVDAEGADDEIPSVFVGELSRFATTDVDSAPVAAPAVLSAPALVGRLRAVACAAAGAVEDSERIAAATELARLAKAGVPGADPVDWHGLAPVSTDQPLRAAEDGAVVTLSPSALQTLLDCPLRWLVEQHGGAAGRDLRSTIGSVLHALISGPDSTESGLLTELDRAWRQLPFDAQWYSANELARHRAMLQNFLRWRQQSRDQLTEVGVEVGFDGMVNGVRLRGRIDRVERDRGGRLVVVDVKTGKTPVSKSDAQQHAQLAIYQLAVDAGLIEHGDSTGGALLIYIGKPGSAGAAEREQDPFTETTRDDWRQVVAQAAAAATGPRFVARVNDGCRHCPIRPICPAYTEQSGQ